MALSRRRLAGALERGGLLVPALRVWERLLALRAPRATCEGDGPPLPPARLRVLVAGDADADVFVRQGAALAQLIRDTLANVGVELERLEAILDFGCGCGRVARQWAALGGPEIHGCDYNATLVAWCRDNLPFMTVTVNPPEPPTSLESERFDLVYAISILTHLTGPSQEQWLAEWARVLRPGGLLLFTTHGDWYRSSLPPGDVARYDRGELVVLRARAEGTNACAAYHPEAYVRERLLVDWTLLGHTPGVEGGTILQDVYAARRR